MALVDTQKCTVLIDARTRPDVSSVPIGGTNNNYTLYLEKYYQRAFTMNSQAKDVQMVPLTWKHYSTGSTRHLS